MGETFRLNEPAVAFEEIDGEVVIIHFSNGHYHSLGGAGAEVFGALVRGFSPPQIVEAMLTRHDVGRERVEEALSAFVEDLLARALIVREPAGRSLDGIALETAEAARSEFEAPTLESFTDMEHFLLLDPVHEVDQSGWPSLPVSAEENGDEPGPSIDP